MCWGGLMAKALEEIQEFYKKSLKNLSEKRQRQILNGLIYLGLFFPFFEHGKIGYYGNNIIPDNCSLWQIFLCLPFIPFLLLLIFYCYLKEEINPYKNYAPIYFSCYLILTWALCLSGLHTHSDWISSYEILFVKETNWSYLFWKKFVGFYLSLGFSLLGLIVSFFYWFKRSNFKNPQS